MGPHPDQSRTKNLQNQGKKINLSLSEMAQFFMKMAQAIKKKKLKPGKSIPGCNSYFLCKYLKDTMLQVKELVKIDATVRVLSESTFLGRLIRHDASALARYE